MADWYSDLEPKIRDIVHLLRNNGWNTTCSCGHEMYVDLDIQHADDVERLATFLVESELSPFRISLELGVPKDGCWMRQATIKFGSIVPPKSISIPAPAIPASAS